PILLSSRGPRAVAAGPDSWKDDRMSSIEPDETPSVPVPPAAPEAPATPEPPTAAPAYGAAPVAPAAAAPTPAAPAAVPYGAAYAAPGPVEPRGLSITAMVCGIVGVVLAFVWLGFLPAAAAVVFGH